MAGERDKLLVLVAFGELDSEENVRCLALATEGENDVSQAPAEDNLSVLCLPLVVLLAVAEVVVLVNGLN